MSINDEESDIEKEDLENEETKTKMTTLFPIFSKTQQALRKIKTMTS